MRSHFGTAMRSHFWTANRITGLENGPTPVPQTATGKGGAVEGGGGKFCITKEAPWIASLIRGWSRTRSRECVPSHRFSSGPSTSSKNHV